VTIVGDRTYGKPVGQYVLPFCDKVLAPVSFSMVNADGQGDYFGGLPVDCRAADDISRELGDAGEASLATALGYLRTGACPAISQPLGARRAAAAPARAVGWAALVNAH
jgi:carboxyl-terminal processing protease